MSADEKYGIENLSTQHYSLNVFEKVLGATNSIDFFNPNNIQIIIDFLEEHPILSYILGKEIFDPLYDKILRPIVMELATAIKSKSLMILQSHKKPKLVDIYIELKLSKGKLVTAVSPDMTEGELKQVFIELINARHTLEVSPKNESYYLLKKNSNGNFTLMSDKEYFASKSHKE